MVISFEEKDRKRIEATGMTVIQVKRVFYTLIDVIRDVLKVVKKYYNSLSPEQKSEFLKNLNIGEEQQYGQHNVVDNIISTVPP